MKQINGVETKKGQNEDYEQLLADKDREISEIQQDYQFKMAEKEREISSMRDKMRDLESKLTMQNGAPRDKDMIGSPSQGKGNSNPNRYRGGSIQKRLTATANNSKSKSGISNSNNDTIPINPSQLQLKGSEVFQPNDMIRKQMIVKSKQPNFNSQQSERSASKLRTSQVQNVQGQPKRTSLKYYQQSNSKRNYDSPNNIDGAGYQNQFQNQNYNQSNLVQVELSQIGHKDLGVEPETERFKRLNELQSTKFELINALEKFPQIRNDSNLKRNSVIYKQREKLETQLRSVEDQINLLSNDGENEENFEE